MKKGCFKKKFIYLNKSKCLGKVKLNLKVTLDSNPR